MAGLSTPQPDQLIGAAGQPAFLNGTTNGTWGNGAGFWKDNEGVVHLTGSVKTTGQVNMFQLPAGYRPVVAGGGTIFFPALVAGGAASFISIDVNGNVASAGAFTNIGLAGVSFKARA